MYKSIHTYYSTVTFQDMKPRSMIDVRVWWKRTHEHSDPQSHRKHRGGVAGGQGRRKRWFFWSKNARWKQATNGCRNPTLAILKKDFVAWINFCMTL